MSTEHTLQSNNSAWIESLLGNKLIITIVCNAFERRQWGSITKPIITEHNNLYNCLIFQLFNYSIAY